MEMKRGAGSECESGAGAYHKRVENLIGIGGIETGVAVDDGTFKTGDVLPVGMDHHTAFDTVGRKVDSLVDLRKSGSTVGVQRSLDKDIDRIVGPDLNILKTFAGKTVDIKTEARAAPGD